MFKELLLFFCSSHEKLGQPFVSFAPVIVIILHSMDDQIKPTALFRVIKNRMKSISRDFEDDCLENRSRTISIQIFCESSPL